MKHRLEMQVSGSITFDHAIALYQHLISVGREMFNLYSMSATNTGQGIHCTTDFPFSKGDFVVSKSETVKERDLVTRMHHAAIRFQQDVAESLSPDPLVANAPKMRYHQDHGRLTLSDIAQLPIDGFVAYKQAESLPLIGDRLSLDFPFVPEREISVSRSDGIYHVRLIATYRRDLRKLGHGFREISGLS